MHADDLAALQGRKLEWDKYLAHPITKEILQDTAAQEEAFVDLICKHDVTNVETFFAHFAAVGHLKGLRYVRQLITEPVVLLEAQINQLEK